MRVACEGLDSPVWRLTMQPAGAGEIVLSAEGLERLLRVLTDAEHADGCRMLVLEGSGGTFCRGMDLGALVADPAVHAAAGTEQYARCLAALHQSSRVVVALVDGVVLAGGVGLAAAADLVIATRGSSFGLPETVVGLVPAMVLPLLCERMPVQKARAFALQGTAVDAEQAERWGLVDRMVDDASALERAFRAAAKQVLRLEPAAVVRLKAWSRRTAALPVGEALTEGAALTAELAAEPERLGHIRAFLDGEPLPWFARYRPKGGAS